MQPQCDAGHLKKAKSFKPADHIILKRIKEGSREALALLWQAHSANVLNLAFRMMKDRDQAEDILMDVFVLVPKAVKGFRGESALSTWLYRLTVNACLMKLRAQKRHRELEEEKLDTIIEEAFGKSDVQSDIGFDPQLLTLGMNELPAETRSMLWLKDAEDLSVNDLAEIYSMPEGTIKARLSRARNFMRNFLKERIYARQQA